MAHPLTERRTYSRFGGSTIAGIRAVLRPGHPVAIVNLSAGGALVSGTRPLRPGSRVFLQITIGGETGGRASQVLRSAVASLDGPAGVRYCSAIRFDDHWDSLWERCTLHGYPVPMAPDDDRSDDGYVLPVVMTAER